MDRVEGGGKRNGKGEAEGDGEAARDGEGRCATAHGAILWTFEQQDSGATAEVFAPHSCVERVSRFSPRAQRFVGSGERAAAALYSILLGACDPLGRFAPVPLAGPQTRAVRREA